MLLHVGQGSTEIPEFLPGQENQYVQYFSNALIKGFVFVWSDEKSSIKYSIKSTP